MKADSPEDAIEQFLQVPGKEGEKGDWYDSPDRRRPKQLHH